MKYLAAAFLLLFSLVAIAFGTYLMFTGEFAQGTAIFFSSATFFFVFILSVMLTKVMKNTEITIAVLTELVENELIKQENLDNQVHPPGITPGITPEWITNNIFNLDQIPEHFRPKSSNPADKYNTMSLEQLDKEKERAVNDQDYELAALLREMIKNRTEV